MAIYLGVAIIAIILMFFLLFEDGMAGMCVGPAILLADHVWLYFWAKKYDEIQKQNSANNTNLSTSEEDYDWEEAVGAQMADFLRNKGMKMCRHGHCYSDKLTKCPDCVQFYAITGKVEQMATQYQKSLADAYSAYGKNGQEELANTFQNSHYGYIVAKVARYLISNKEGVSYAENDFFHYPMPQWHLQAIDEVANQLLFDCKGLTPDRCFAHVSPEAVRELFELCHYTFLSIEKTDVETVYKMNFRHKEEGQTSFAYCEFSDLSTLDSPFHSRVYSRMSVNKRLHGIEPNSPIVVDIVEKNGVIKICHTDDVIAIATEIQYVSQKYPHNNKKSQRRIETDIDGKPTQMDIDVYEFPDGSEKEFVFDISDVKSAFEGFEEELKKRSASDILPKNQFADVMLKRTHEQLIEVVNNPQDYLDDAVEAAQQEIKRRENLAR